MKKILVAFDDSPGAEAALQDLAAGGFPDRCEARVITIADVWLPPEDDANDAVLPERIAATRTQARQHARDALAAAREISARGVERLRSLFPQWTLDSLGCADSPAWGILEVAKKWEADLIVIGSHGRSPLRKFFLGSVSTKVAAEAHCSVRICRRPDGRPDGPPRVLVAVDGSEDGNTAIEEVLERDWPEQSRFQLVTVADQKMKSASVFHTGVLLSSGSSIGVEDSVPAMLAERAEKFRQRGLQVETHILEGDPKSVLLRQEEKWKADCLFIGARGLQHGERLYLGTLASALVTRAECTVEVVRPRPKSGGDNTVG